MKYVIPILAAVAIAVLAFARPSHPAGPGFAASPAGTPPKRNRLRAAGVAQVAVVVYVAGAVARPGLYRLPAGARADDAVRAAGGMRPGADPVAVDLAARVADGDEILVPQEGEATPRPRGGRQRTRASAAPVAAVPLNTAGVDELAAVPGIGRAIAARVVAVRDADGPFATLDELLDVNGMTPARLDRATPYLVVP